MMKRIPIYLALSLFSLWITGLVCNAWQTRIDKAVLDARDLEIQTNFLVSERGRRRYFEAREKFIKELGKDIERLLKQERKKARRRKMIGMGI